MQKAIFLNEEGDAWFDRNRDTFRNRSLDNNDPVASAIIKTLPHIPDADGQLLEIGCGGGERLAWLSENHTLECSGIEPSSKAVANAVKAGVKAVQGTADELPYESNFFDIVVFGFCLYLCDREDLFRITAEANRVLKSNSWLIIHDFFSPTPMSRDYHHRDGICSHKMDYRKLFDWHPYYTCFPHEVKHHLHNTFTDDPSEWVATSIMRKALKPKSE